MSLEYAISILHYFQKWRRGADIPMPDPKEVGEAIDTAIRLMRAEKKLQNLHKGGLKGLPKTIVCNGQTITIKN